MSLPAGVGRLKEIFFCSLSFQRLTEEESHTARSLFDHGHRASKVISEPSVEGDIFFPPSTFLIENILLLQMETCTFKKS